MRSAYDTTNAVREAGDNRLTFGPVPSRRLGRSLGINNIPPKACTYSCVYCQLGPTRATEVVPRAFHTPDEIFEKVKHRVAEVRQKGGQIDYLTFVPDGEPSLDVDLRQTIERLRPLAIPIAIISNASLIWRDDVRKTLAQADWVSLKVDAPDETLWRRINRPHPSLDHRAILDGILTFAGEYKGMLTTESMLVRGENDRTDHARDLADFLGKLAPEVCYLSVPTRPPAEKGICAPEESAVNRVYQAVNQRVEHVELLTGYEGNAFAFTGNLVEDLLSITSVHPMREDAVHELLSSAGADWELIQALVDEHQLVQTEYQGRKFYLRAFIADNVPFATRTKEQ
jgi:wyosine [tRNA(Phe)-imidazoG37] synthetase (radical SAM superfamily)